MDNKKLQARMDKFLSLVDAFGLNLTVTPFTNLHYGVGEEVIREEQMYSVKLDLGITPPDDVEGGFYSSLASFIVTKRSQLLPELQDLFQGLLTKHTTRTQITDHKRWLMDPGDPRLERKVNTIDEHYRDLPKE